MKWLALVLILGGMGFIASQNTLIAYGVGLMLLGHVLQSAD